MRSPNYPAISLADAVSLTQKLWEREKKTVVPPLEAAKTWGYSIMSGPARTKLSALRKYGLVNDIGDGVQVSQLAMRILHQPVGNRDRQDATQEAALKPELFDQVYKTHKDSSDATLCSYLVVSKNFTEEGSKVFAKSFRETISFADLTGDVTVPQHEEDRLKEVPLAKGTNSSGVPITAQMTRVSANSLPIPVGDNVALVPFPMSEEDFDLFIGTLQLWKKKLIKAADLTKSPEVEGESGQ
jgi:hypothetical protein